MKSDDGKMSKVQTPVSHAKSINFGESEVKKDVTDAELSEKYQALKLKEEKLLR